MKQFAKLFAATALALTPVVAVLAIPATANAEAIQTPGFPLVTGLPSDETAAERLAGLISASLKKDSHGNACLQEERCKAGGPRVTPRMYLEGIVKWHPKSGFTMSDADLAKLPIYIRSLRYAVVPGGKFLSSRTIRVDAEWQLDLNSGFARELEKGEFAWYDTQTGEVIFLANCGNIAKTPDLEEVVLQSNCVADNYVVPPGTVKVMVAVTGKRDVRLSRTCKASYRQNGERAFTLAHEDCDALKCFADPIGDAQDRGRNTDNSVVYSYDNVKPGPAVFKLSTDVKYDSVIICVEVRGDDGKIHAWYSSYLDFHPTDGGSVDEAEGLENFSTHSFEPKNP